MPAAEHDAAVDVCATARRVRVDMVRLAVRRGSVASAPAAASVSDGESDSLLRRVQARFAAEVERIALSASARPLIRAALVAVLAVAALTAIPTAAQASTIYPPSGACSSSPTAAQAGETFTFGCEAGTFSAEEAVTITVTGENGAAAAIGMVRFAITTTSAIVESGVDGSLADVEITLPDDATGTYNVAAVSATSAGGTAAVSIAGADGLPSTGLDGNSTLGIWIGGGALVAAGVALALAG